MTAAGCAKLANSGAVAVDRRLAKQGRTDTLLRGARAPSPAVSRASRDTSSARESFLAGRQRSPEQSKHPRC